MSNLMESVFERAKLRGKTIILAEGEEGRIIQAAIKITTLNIAKVILLGNPDVIASKASEAELSGITIVDYKTSPLKDKYANLIYELRKDKGMTVEKANELINNYLYFGVAMVKAGDADGMVAGSICATGDVLRPALQIIKTKPGIKTVSSCFVMILPENSPYKISNVLLFADCAVNPEPTSAQLADIAVATAESAKQIAGISPKIAMLSFSTKGSAKHELVDKVVEATKILKETAPELEVDGELQADAALISSVGQLKSPGSTVAGKANVLVFPDLQAGNIGYKLVQRLAGAEAIGPICQGFAKPVNDLSRGCSPDDVVAVVAMTALQA